VLDIAIANALFTLLNAMGRVLDELGWSYITEGRIVQEYTHVYPTSGACVWRSR